MPGKADTLRRPKILRVRADPQRGADSRTQAQGTDAWEGRSSLSTIGRHCVLLGASSTALQPRRSAQSGTVRWSLRWLDRCVRQQPENMFFGTLLECPGFSMLFHACAVVCVGVGVSRMHMFAHVRTRDSHTHTQHSTCACVCCGVCGWASLLYVYVCTCTTPTAHQHTTAAAQQAPLAKGRVFLTNL